jgi:hypothetical protein
VASSSKVVRREPTGSSMAYGERDAWPKVREAPGPRPTRPAAGSRSPTAPPARPSPAQLLATSPWLTLKKALFGSPRLRARSRALVRAYLAENRATAVVLEGGGPVQ